MPLATLPLLGVLLERLLHDRDRLAVAERLLDEVDCSFLDRGDRRPHVAVGGDEDDRNVDLVALEVLLQLEAAHAGETQVEHQAPGSAGLIGSDELRSGIECADGDAVRLHQPGPQRADRLVVLDDVSGRRHAACLERVASEQGNVNEKQLPLPEPLLTQIRPPKCATMRRQICKPGPLPTVSGLCAAWRNLSKMISRSRASTPGPLSRTSTRRKPPSSTRLSSTRPLPGSQNFAALERRLSTTWMMRSTSARTTDTRSGVLSCTAMLRS